MAIVIRVVRLSTQVLLRPRCFLLSVNGMRQSALTVHPVHISDSHEYSVQAEGPDLFISSEEAYGTRHGHAVPFVSSNTFFLRFFAIRFCQSQLTPSCFLHNQCYVTHATSPTSPRHPRHQL